jgi:ElaB/YqjD/DUF883 family membrane-anchored ribosome-binding protein
MPTLLLSIALLLSPVQDSVSVEKFEELESRLDKLEERVIRREAEGDAIEDVLYGERTWWTATVTVIVGLIALLGYGQFLNKVEESKKSFEDEVGLLKEEVSFVGNEMKIFKADIYDALCEIRKKRGDFGDAILNKVFEIKSRSKYEGEKRSGVMGKTKELNNLLSDAIDESYKLELSNKRRIKNTLSNIISRSVQGSVQYEIQDAQERVDILYKENGVEE